MGFSNISEALELELELAMGTGDWSRQGWMAMVRPGRGRVEMARTG